MSAWDVIDLLGGLLFLAAALGILIFIVLYGFRSNWRATPEGRVTFRFKLIVFTIMIAAIVFGVLPESLFVTNIRLMVRLVLYGLLVGGIVHLNIILIRAQNRDRRDDWST